MKLYLYRILIFFLLLSVYDHSFGQNLLTTTEPKPNSVQFSTDLILRWNSSLLELPQRSYSYRIATDSNFTNIVSQRSGINQYTDTLQNFLNGTFYWQLSLNDTNGTIANSEVVSFVRSDILSANSYTHFYSADTGLVLDAQNRLFKWLNLADTSNSLSQSDTSSRPTIALDSNNGNLLHVAFDGVNDFLEFNSAFNFGDLFIVANWQGGSTFSGFPGLVTGSTSYIVLVGDGISGTRTNFFSTNPVPIVNSITTSSFAPLQDYKLVNFFRTSVLNAANLQIGKDRGFSNRFWNGGVSDLIISRDPLSSANRHIVNQYLCQKYFKPLDLGSDIISTYGVCDSIVRADSTYSTYTWSTNDTTEQITVEMGKEYTLTVTDDFGCTYEDNIKYQEVFVYPGDQILCPGDSFIWDLGLSHSAYTFLWNDSSSDSLLRIDQEGNYAVVVTDSTNCSVISDTINVQFDSSLFQYRLGPDTSVCQGNAIELMNYDSSLTQILWSTGNTSPIQIIDTAGIYTVTFSNGSCQRSDTIQVSIQGLAPTANFIFSELCLRDSVMFVDSSTAPIGDSIIGFNWNFAGLAADSTPNPLYSFPDTGNFMVELKVITDKGCEDTSRKIVDIKPLPLVDFFVSGDCARRPLQFTNNSSIVEGSLQSFLWDYGDGLQGTQQSPIRAYANSGSYDVKLRVTSDQNCSDSAIRNILVNATPLNSYFFSGSCLGDSSRLISTSSIDTGRIENYTWLVNQQVIEDSIAKVLFLSSGKREIILRTESDSGCVEILRDSIDVFEPPLAHFFASDVCEGDSLRVIDSSISQGDSIVAYRYLLSNGQTVQNSVLQNPVFELPELGDYQLKQIVESANGCLDSLTQTVSLNANPTADFQILNNGSGIPMTLDVNNTSQLASSFEWNSGNGQTSNLDEPMFVYQDTGTYQLSLIAISDESCRDTLINDLRVLPSFLDAAILNAQILEGFSDEYRIRLQIANEGTNGIQELLVSVLPDGEQGLAELLNIDLYSGQNVSQLLNTILVNEENRPSFICFEIVTVNGVNDENSANDRFCLSAFPNELFLRAFPNPFNEQLQIEFVLIEGSPIKISLIDVSGREALSIANEQFFEAGYHNLSIATSALSSGTYLLRFELGGGINQLKLIKQ